MRKHFPTLYRLSRFAIAVGEILPSRFLKWVWKFFILRLKKQEVDGFTPSVYGPWLRSNWSDATFGYAITGHWGFRLYDLLTNTNRAPFVFVDIGANIGLYSLVAMDSLKCVAAHAIEPNPSVYEYLEQNVKRNDQSIECHRVGIGNENGGATLSYKTHNSGRGSLVQKFNHSVEIVLRDYSLLNEIGNQHVGKRFFLKIDVEGFEAQVVRQLKKSNIVDQIDDVFIEITPTWVSDEDINFIFMTMRDLGLQEVWRSRGNTQYDVHFSRSV